jgi:hypothetical protein
VDDVVEYLCSVADRRKIFFLWRPFLRDPDDDLVLELAVDRLRLHRHTQFLDWLDRYLGPVS